MIVDIHPQNFQSALNNGSRPNRSRKSALPEMGGDATNED